MTKEEWGIKRQCLSCGARFYDLNRNPIICPKCETVFEPEPLLKSRRWQGGNAKPEKKEVVPENVVAESKHDDPVDEVEEVEDDDSADALLTNDDDDDDVSDVLVGPIKSESDT